MTFQVRPAADDRTAAALRQLVQDKVASRIAAGDPDLWGPEARDEASIRLGWVGLALASRPLLAEIDALGADLRAEGVDRVVLCGMGGSSLAPEVIAAAAGVELVILDSTDPDTVRPVVADGVTSTVVVVSSKSGSTLETDTQRRAFVAAFEEAGVDAASRIVVVTDPGSALAELATTEGYRSVFLADPNVGGRYSALSAFGLVPAGLAGADVGALLDEAAAVAEDLARDDEDNPALALAASLAGGAPPRDKVVLPEADPALPGFAAWVEQLLAESTGKQGTGLLPVVVEGVDAPELAGPAADVLPVLVRAGGAAATESRAAPADPAGDETPPGAVVVSGPLGAQFLVWEYATAAAGRLLGINPFDQPDVESAKVAARGLLDERPEAVPPAFVEGVVEVRGSAGLLDGVGDLAGAVVALLDRVDPDGYLAVMAYLDRDQDAALAGVRSALAARTGRPVTFGWGPRFLHSTGQFHKGGPPVGAFLQITGDCSLDLDIPGRPFTCGQLLEAQAAGDAQVLEGLGRPVLRLHLVDRALGRTQLIEALGR